MDNSARATKLELHQETLQNLIPNPFDGPMFGTNVVSGCMPCIPPSEVPSCQT